MAGELERLAYDTAVQAVQDQATELSQLRAQTGTLLTAGSITASFLGAQALGHGKGLGPFGGLALVAFVVSTLASIYVLLPKRGFVFSLNAPSLYEALYGEGDEATIHRITAYWLEDFWADNRSKMDHLIRWFFVAGTALVAEVVFWALALRDTIPV